MITDEERREVERRLRETGEELGSGALLWCHIAKALGVRTATDGKTACGMLADLIEPDEQKVKCIAEIKIDGERLEQLVNDAVFEVTGIDRDALLELADEMEGEKRDISCATCRADFGLACYDYKPNATCMEACLRYYARRIRKVLGV